MRHDKRLTRIAALAAAVLLAHPLAASAGAPPGRYTLSADVVTDTKTKLTWQRNAPTTSYTWVNAEAYCKDLSLSGPGWRLPTVKELQSLVDVRAFSPAIDTTAFPKTPSAWFWSQTQYAGDAAHAWVVPFGGGNSVHTRLTYSNRVRCVR